MSRPLKCVPPPFDCQLVSSTSEWTIQEKVSGRWQGRVYRVTNQCFVNSDGVVSAENSG